MPDKEDTQPGTPRAKKASEEAVSVKKVTDELKGLAGWVQGKKAEAVPTAAKAGSPWGWVVGLVVSAVVFLVLAFVGFALWRKGRELAKLKHEKDVAEEKKKQAEVDQAADKLMVRKAALGKEIEELTDEIETAQKAISLIESDREKLHEKINKITNWDDLDVYMGDDK